MIDYLNKITDKNLKDFVEESIKLYGNEKKTVEANKVCDYIHNVLLVNHLISEDTTNAIEYTLIASAYLHNLFFDSKEYDGQNWIDLFKAREKLFSIGKKHDVTTDILDVIFTTIESQLGQDTPIPALRPKFGTPTQTFVEGIWLVKHYIK